SAVSVRSTYCLSFATTSFSPSSFFLPFPSSSPFSLLFSLLLPLSSFPPPSSPSSLSFSSFLPPLPLPSPSSSPSSFFS
ncbi:hypothetical protein ACXWRW_11645, partial [Streptococcus pyogenes]